MYLCRCNNCDEIWEDINPSEDSFDFDPDELDETPLPLDAFEDDDGIFWGCPICETDAYLIDIKDDSGLFVRWNWVDVPLNTFMKLI